MGERRDELLAAQYFVAVAGLAAMRTVLVEPSAARPRLDEVIGVVRALDEFPNDLRIPVVEHDLDDGYTRWAERYDGPNPATAVDDDVVGSLLASLPVGVALDAACGTGRHSARLVALGHDVIGVDANAAMLDIARVKVPSADLRTGELTALPVDDAAVDLVVCSLALTHVPDVGPVLREFARVLRPGGRVVLSDMHPVSTTFGGAAVFPTGSDAFELHFVRNLVHPVSTYITAIHDAGLAIRRCLEPSVPEADLRFNPAYSVLPDAVRAAFGGLPFLLVWELERAAS